MNFPKQGITIIKSTKRTRKTRRSVSIHSPFPLFLFFFLVSMFPRHSTIYIHTLFDSGPGSQDEDEEFEEEEDRPEALGADEDLEIEELAGADFRSTLTRVQRQVQAPPSFACFPSFFKSSIRIAHSVIPFSSP